MYTFTFFYLQYNPLGLNYFCWLTKQLHRSASKQPPNPNFSGLPQTTMTANDNANESIGYIEITTKVLTFLELCRMVSIMALGLLLKSKNKEKIQI